MLSNTWPLSGARRDWAIVLRKKRSAAPPSRVDRITQSPLLRDWPDMFRKCCLTRNIGNPFKD